MFFAPAAVNAQEVTYVEDPAQGYIFNRFQDNWFIEAEGGAGVMLSTWDRVGKFKDRIGWKANLAVGKWFSPIIGLRIGGEINKMRGFANTQAANGALGLRIDNKKTTTQGCTYQNFNNIGGFGDVLINLTNWWCGYKPNRVYNAVVYAGMGVHWVFEREGNTANGKFKYNGGKDGHSRNFSARAGLLNEFRLSKHVNLLLDLRFDLMQEHVDGHGQRTWIEYPSALLGLQYKFNKTEWNAPVVPVCNQPVVIDNSAELEALRQKLAQANAKIADLEYQLAECLKKIKPVDPNTVVTKSGPLATIYYPIGKSNITPVQMEVVNAVAEVMKAEDKNYVLTGWADNYTGNDAINIKLRHDRVNGVKNTLVKKGIDAGRLAAETNNENLVNLGPQCAPLGRAVTIERAE
ncbi:MAG: OmpA family protein [Muribaculaceae bacterium]|nr:OmpA family protein [Muribaculaceae bacterium]